MYHARMRLTSAHNSTQQILNESLDRLARCSRLRTLVDEYFF